MAELSPVPLSADWEADTMLRNRGRQQGVLTTWLKPEATGVASMKAAALNHKLLEITSHWWVQLCDQPSAIPIGLLRSEVGIKIEKMKQISNLNLKLIIPWFFGLALKYHFGLRCKKNLLINTTLLSEPNPKSSQKIFFMHSPNPQGECLAQLNGSARGCIQSWSGRVGHQTAL